MYIYIYIYTLYIYIERERDCVISYHIISCTYLEACSTNTECYVWRFRPRKRILVTFRGTSDFGDVLIDISAVPKDLGELGYVHAGFSRAYASVREALLAVVARGCGGRGEGWEVLFTGHSLGGALATLASLDMARVGGGVETSLTGEELPHGAAPLRGISVLACTFGAPRVGSARLCALCDEWVPRAWRVYSTSDIVPTVPPTSLWGFYHCGVAVELDPEDNKLTVRGRTPNLAAKKADEEMGRGQAAAEDPEAVDWRLWTDAAEDVPFRDGRKQSDIWSAFDGEELEELRRVLSTGTQAVGEHMEANNYARIETKASIPHPLWVVVVVYRFSPCDKGALGGLSFMEGNPGSTENGVVSSFRAAERRAEAEAYMCV